MGRWLRYGVRYLLHIKRQISQRPVSTVRVMSIGVYTYHINILVKYVVFDGMMSE